MTFSIISFLICSCDTSGLCCAEMTTVSTRFTTPSSYSTVTCDFPSGRKYERVPSFLTAVSFLVSACDSTIGIGISSSVSSQAKPNIMP